jgi:hypothetical protein
MVLAHAGHQVHTGISENPFGITKWWMVFQNYTFLKNHPDMEKPDGIHSAGKI